MDHQLPHDVDPTVSVIRPSDIVVDRLTFYRDSSSSSSIFCLLSYLIFVSYPPSSLNGTQPKPAMHMLGTSHSLGSECDFKMYV